VACFPEANSLNFSSNPEIYGRPFLDFPEGGVLCNFSRIQVEDFADRRSLPYDHTVVSSRIQSSRTTVQKQWERCAGLENKGNGVQTVNSNSHSYNGPGGQQTRLRNTMPVTHHGSRLCSLMVSSQHEGLLDIFKEPNQVRHTDRTIKMALLLFSGDCWIAESSGRCVVISYFQPCTEPHLFLAKRIPMCGQTT
jgi:hypothetical protein